MLITNCLTWNKMDVDWSNLCCCWDRERTKAFMLKNPTSYFMADAKLRVVKLKDFHNNSFAVIAKKKHESEEAKQNSDKMSAVRKAYELKDGETSKDLVLDEDFCIHRNNDSN